MKRSEAIEHIQDVLEEILHSRNLVTTKRYPYWIKAKAADILDMLQGFGMEPPINDMKSFEHSTQINMWEEE